MLDHLDIFALADIARDVQHADREFARYLFNERAAEVLAIGVPSDVITVRELSASVNGAP